MTAELNELIDESIKVERNMEALYKLLAGIFPDDAAFFEQLEEEESNHALLLELAKKYLAPVGTFPEGMLAGNLQMVAQANERIESAVDEYKESPPTRQEALDFAVRMELSAGEIHYQFAMDHGEEPEAETFRDLNGGDKDHAGRIKAYMGQD